MSPLISLTNHSFGFGTTFPKIATNGLVLHLDVGQQNSYPGIGITWTDLSGKLNKGQLVSSIPYNGSNGGSLEFDGINDFVDFPFLDGVYPTGSQARTLCAYFNATDITTGREIFCIGGNSINGDRSALWIDSNGAGVECRNTAILTSSWSGINNWVHLCATYESGGNVHSFKIYVNGEEKSTTTYGSTTSLNTTNQQCVVGAIPFADEDYRFAGKISQVLLYNRSLTEIEIKQNYDAIKYRYN